MTANISIISRKQLEIINRTTLKYPLHIAEKDYFLTIAMQIIASSHLQDTLVFKGGTALHHCYLDQYRFSEDLDFSSHHTFSLSDLRNIFTDFDFFSIVKDYSSPATRKIEKLQYRGPLIQPNSLKAEVDILQNVLLPTQTVVYNNVWGIDFEVKVMDHREICAEKIRAISSRARYRDFYDLYLLVAQYALDLKEIVDYVKQKEIREPITTSNIQDNWNLVNKLHDTEVGQIHYSKKITNTKIQDLLNQLPFTDLI